ncbi:MAG: FHA domain-containing protein [Pseudomonadota bacterium]
MSATYGFESRFPPVEEVSAKLSAKIDESSETQTEIDTQTSRVRTRFLNFKLNQKPRTAAAASAQKLEPEIARDKAALGWLAIVEGAGEGRTFALDKHAIQIGRGEDQDIQLAFGDNAISRKSHAIIVYYGEQRGFLIRDGRKPNPVLVNGRSLPDEAYLKTGDLIRIGETTLRFMYAPKGGVN